MTNELEPKSPSIEAETFGLEVWEKVKGNGDNRLRTEWCAQPWALRAGDILATGEEIISEPVEGGNGGVNIKLKYGSYGHEIRVPARIPIALSISEVMKFRPKFEGLQNERERIVYGLLGSSLRVFLYGVHSMIPKLRKEGGDELRVGGQLLANTFDLDDETVKNLASSLEDEIDLGGRVPGIRSFITARLAEGIYEAGQKEVAKSLVDSLSAYPDVQSVVLDYFSLKDADCVRSEHA